jgi:hypothetical protein
MRTNQAINKCRSLTKEVGFVFNSLRPFILLRDGGKTDPGCWIKQKRFIFHYEHQYVYQTFLEDFIRVCNLVIRRLGRWGIHTLR